MHIHTIYSDGNLTPDQVIAKAEKAGLSAIAFADHDSVDALNNYLKPSPIEIVPCAELSAREGGKSVHILGYFMDHNDNNLKQFIEIQRKARLSRGEEIVKKLNGLGLNITMDEVRKKVEGSVVGRPHIARVLLEKGIVEKLGDAFSLYLGNDKSCYVPNPDKKVREIVNIIKGAGGIPVLAHPIFLGDDELISRFIDEGIEGIEVWYPQSRDRDIEKYLEIARKRDLVVTGGSDSHGTLKPYPSIGDFKVAYQAFSDCSMLKLKSFPLIH